MTALTPALRARARAESRSGTSSRWAWVSTSSRSSGMEGFEGLFLDDEELFYALFGQVEEGFKGLAGEGMGLRGALDLYEMSLGRHHHIEVHPGPGVLVVAHVQHLLPTHHPHAHPRYLAP